MDLDAVMQEVAAVLDTIDGLRVYGYAADAVAPPAAVVGYPTVTYDETMRRGMDRYSLPVWLLVGKVSDRASRPGIAPYVAGDGDRSVKRVLEAGIYQSLDSLRVQDAEPDELVEGGVAYLAYRFTIDIAGTGAP